MAIFESYPAYAPNKPKLSILKIMQLSIFTLMISSSEKVRLLDFTLEELRDYFKSKVVTQYRGDQVFNWIYNYLVSEFSEMKNLSKELRNKLDEECLIHILTLKEVQDSPSTKTKKYLFSTLDGYNIESVLIPDEKRNTLCISTQVGCPLDCKFCATGLMGYKRNLSAGEIVNQYLFVAKKFGKINITNIVYMGMGEPLLNFDATLKSLRIFTSELNKGLSRNRITISTAGIPSKIIELADSGIRVKLALSLHSCFEDIRTKLMPINKKYSLKENISAIKYYTQKTKTRVTFEYTMIKGINDRNKDIKGLAKLCNQLSAKINIIPFNSIAHMNPLGISAELEPTSRERIIEFADGLRIKNITVMIRNTQGDDIAAACGQLASKI